MRTATLIAVATLALPGASVAGDDQADDHRASGQCIAQDYAVDIAFQHALVGVDRQERDGQAREIEGEDARSEETGIEISCTAEVLQVEYED